MKHLLILAHPNPDSYSANVTLYIKELLEKRGNRCIVRNLYEINFNPVLSKSDLDMARKDTLSEDILNEQNFVSDADYISVIYPLWWGGMPAILKGYIDRVFSYDFAYHYTDFGSEGLLKGKKVILITPMGSPEEIYKETGMIDAMKKNVDDTIFNFCGMEVVEHKFLGAVTNADHETRISYLEEIKNIYLGLH